MNRLLRSLIIASMLPGLVAVLMTYLGVLLSTNGRPFPGDLMVLCGHAFGYWVAVTVAVADEKIPVWQRIVVVGVGLVSTHVFHSFIITWTIHQIGIRS